MLPKSLVAYTSSMRISAKKHSTNLLGVKNSTIDSISQEVFAVVVLSKP
jgi:hypothetical protein